MRNIARIFGTNNSLLYPFVQLILKENNGKKYFFMNQDEWQQIISKSVSYGNKVLWMELFSRIHYASIINLLRIKKWLDSISLAYEKGNLLSFCSSMRGLIEFGADSHFTFAAIPFHLAEEFTEIKSVFKGGGKEIIINQALEDALLHFSFAGRQSEKNERSKVYNAKQVKQYIEYSDKTGKLYDFYQNLSGYTHPSIESVTSYLEIAKYDIGEHLTVMEKDDEMINKLIYENHGLIENVLCLSIYPSLFNLKILTMFEIDEFISQSIEGICYEQFDVWNEIMYKIKNYA